MLIVDRNRFLAWTQGILLDRNEKGQCIIGDYIQCEEAEKALTRGEDIGLSVDGRLVSKMVTTEECYQEELLDKDG